jgi:hypothetical protein
LFFPYYYLPCEGWIKHKFTCFRHLIPSFISTKSGTLLEHFFGGGRYSSWMYA